MSDGAIQQRLRELLPEVDGAHHVDVKCVESAAPLRVFVARMFSYQPRWYRALFRLRGLLARCLGLRHAGLEGFAVLSPETLGFAPGETVLFFTVLRAEEEAYWVGHVQDRHLTAAVAIWFAPLPEGRRRYYVATVVHFRNRVGPLYFRLIEPFHHLLVRASARHAAAWRP